MKSLLWIALMATMHAPLGGQSHLKLARELFDSYSKYRLPEITSRRFTQADLLRWLKPLEDQKVFEKTEIGKSAEGRPIYLLRVGTGPVKVMLWSQMHGDEATATMALLDMLSFFALEAQHDAARTLRSKLTLLLIPMINPDGAERFQRRTAQQIDMNRDALRLGTPEARILKETSQKYEPEFGFNLHDQDPHYTAGSTTRVAALALLAPATDAENSKNAVREKAKHVTALFADVMNLFVPGHLARYDDTFEPRAFGDNIQRWGTSTVLVESGGWPGDRDKMFLRKLNCVGLLTTLYAVARGDYELSDVSLYERLPFNTKNLYDIILRNATYTANGQTPPLKVDIGINVEEKVDSLNGKLTLIGTVADIGDLSTCGFFQEHDVSGMQFDGRSIALEKKIPMEDLTKMLQSK